MNNKLKLVFAYYITSENTINYIHQLHIYILKKYINIFTDIDFIILIDDINNGDAINLHKDYIVNQFNEKPINFTIEQYNNYGSVYVKYVIDRLNEFNDDLVFFAYSKGLTTQNLENTKQWIAFMYFMNLEYFNNALEQLIDSSNDDYKEYVCYGTLYNNFHNKYHQESKYGWRYIGGFQWINPKRIITYINENDVNIDFVHKIELKNKTSIESFLPNIFDETHVGFKNEHIYNKDVNILEWHRNDIINTQILFVGCSLIQFNDYVNFLTFYNNEINNFTQL